MLRMPAVCKEARDSRLRSGRELNELRRTRGKLGDAAMLDRAGHTGILAETGFAAGGEFRQSWLEKGRLEWLQSRFALGCLLPPPADDPVSTPERCESHAKRTMC